MKLEAEMYVRTKRKEILDYMEDREGSMLGRSMYDAIVDKIDSQQSQLDIANKKLDKIKEHVENSKFYYKDEDSEEIYEDYYPSATDILSIIGGE